MGILTNKYFLYGIVAAVLIIAVILRKGPAVIQAPVRKIVGA